MSEVSTRPQKAAKAAPASQKAIQASSTAPQKSEAEELQAKALQILLFVITNLAESGLSGIPGALHAANQADSIGYSMCYPNDSGTIPPAPLDGLALICHHLGTVEPYLESADDVDLHVAISASALLAHAQQLAHRLHAAIEGLPGTLEDLRALTTYAGAKTYRDRPTPPIRRDPAATLEPGQLSRAQLQLFMEQVADGLKTTNQTLKMAQTSDEAWQRQSCLDAGQLMVQSLGAIADHASGFTIGGSIGDWVCGPFFNDLGE